jgi:succinate dehydrogenase/fumarate reductase flavoprotein subunit
VKAKKAVILCTGPFDFNDEMVRNYLRPYPMKFAGWKFNTGDGIPMAANVGARLWHMNGFCGYFCAWFEEGKAGYLVMGPRNPSWMFCDKYGKRFADESRLMEHNFWKHMTEIDETGLGFSRNPGWIVFDETARKSGPVASSYSSWLPEGLGGAPAFSRDNSKEIENGWIIKGDTLKELAEKTGMNSDNLKTEIDHINQAVAKAVPDKFGRTTQGVLGPMGSWDNGPYYAMKVYVGGISTMGGPERNEKGQVVGWDGKPIARLYEAGALGSIWGDHYGPFGGNVGVSVVAGGRIAGRNAAAEKPWS